METIQPILDEIEEIETLIGQWDGSADPEVRWAISLLNYTLRERYRQLRQTITGKTALNHRH